MFFMPAHNLLNRVLIFPAMVAIVTLTLLSLPVFAGDDLLYTYETITQDATTLTGKITVTTPSTTYIWNAGFFAIRAILFTTTATITSMSSSNGGVTFTQNGDQVSIDLGWQSLCTLGTRIELTFQATKGSGDATPHSFYTGYVRGGDIRYPEYADLPASWRSQKSDLSAADLIRDPAAYYDSSVSAEKATMIVYTPVHATQLRLARTRTVPYPVNGNNDLRVWIPGRLMALGVGVAYEFYKMNPNFMTALGTKENFAAGLVPPSAGNFSNPQNIDGETWYWPMVAHIDGPYQQETGNFLDCSSFFPDLFPDNAQHDDFTSITVDTTDVRWISSAISSAISITVTREFLNAIFDGYNQFMDNAADPWAEFSIVDYTYNRGAADFLSYKLFSDNRLAAMASKDIVADFAMGGFASHVQTVRAITTALNEDTSDIYDGWLSRADISEVCTQLRKFYGRGVPSSDEWTTVDKDLDAAFDILSAHWGNGKVSVRYDFLTLLRVIKKHLPHPINPRPTGSNWYYQVKGALQPTAIQANHQRHHILPARLHGYARQVAGGIRFSVRNYSGDGGDVTVVVLNTAGKTLRALQASSGPAAEIFWDLRDRSGNSVAPGMYPTLITAGANRTVITLAITGQ